VGKLALVNVWATWCVGCRQEHPFLVELSKSAGIPIYGLNWKDDRGQAMSWLSQLGDPYEASGFDESGDAAIDWGVYGAPETFLLAPDGTVLYKHLSPLTAEVWSTEFMPRIAAARGN
jgi:cytochrome c biogenesis protein CcmG/thiol:disulfide interchange protein DsbE